MNPNPTLSQDEKHILLSLARQSIELAVNQLPLPELDLESYSPLLRENGASFVTLTEGGELRGCIGALEPYQPLVQDVCEHAVSAAMEDYRFHPGDASRAAAIGNRDFSPHPPTAPGVQHPAGAGHLSAPGHRRRGAA